MQAAYRWLADNYQEGDCIFLFGETISSDVWAARLTMEIGFSRGAFQVRALAGMIEKVSSRRLFRD